MSSPTSIEIVRRPIGLKIFAIAVSLLVLMIIVALSSSMNLKLVRQELVLLSDYYIPLEQMVGDVRAEILREVIQIERVVELRHKDPTIGMSQASNDKIMTLFRETGDCDPDALSKVLRSERQANPGLSRGEQQLMSYRVRRLCTNARLNRATALVGQARALKQVMGEPMRVARFTDIKSGFTNIGPERDKLHASFEKYLARSGTGDQNVLDLLREQVDVNRRDINRRINTVTRELNAGTRESAELTQKLEARSQWLNWSVTFVACILGLLFAGAITRSLVRPVRELLSVTKAVRAGNLDVNIQISTSDEIGQLADSFNHMVGELKQKELIKKMFGKYVDPRIVRGLLLDRQPFAQGGERQLMTVFFSDLEGFTAVCEGLTPTAAVHLLNQYFSLVAEPIRAQQGIIDKYIGDSVMAFWGPPFTSASDHAAFACRAALDQQACVPKLQAMLPEVLGIRKNLPNIRVRMGIATGDVTVGSIGSEDIRSYTVIGDTVNLASRLEGANKQYGTQILISEDTCKLASNAIEAREIDAIRVVGKTDPVRVYELVGRKGDISPKIAELCAHYERGLALYRKRKWEEARSAFEECLKIMPGDGPSLLFIDRIRVLEAQSLTEHWDGVWTLTEK